MILAMQAIKTNIMGFLSLKPTQDAADHVIPRDEENAATADENILPRLGHRRSRHPHQVHEEVGAQGHQRGHGDGQDGEKVNMVPMVADTSPAAWPPSTDR